MVGIRAQRIAVVTVHGTGDTAPEPEGPKWFQTGSAFAARLKERLQGRGCSVDVVPHLWSGANSAAARERSSKQLAETIRRLSKTYESVHVVGHSHGGNVANDAACMLGWRPKQRGKRLATITTVGTPFFRTHVTWRERLSAWMFLLLVALSAMAILYSQGSAQIDESKSRLRKNDEVMERRELAKLREEERRELALIAEIETNRTGDVGETFTPEEWATIRASEAPTTPSERLRHETMLKEKLKREERRKEVQRLVQSSDPHARMNANRKVVLESRVPQERLDAIRRLMKETPIYYRQERKERLRGDLVRAGLIIGALVATAITFPLAVQSVRRIRRAGRRRRADREIFAIVHPIDEAIAFLQRVDRLKLEPFPRWSLLRGSRTGAVVSGANVAVLAPLVLLVLFFATALVYNIFPWPAAKAVLDREIDISILIPGWNDARLWQLAPAALTPAAIGGPFIFLIIYATHRLVLGILPELGIRGMLNRGVGSALKGMAFGRDGDNRIGAVSSSSHYFATRRTLLDGEVAQRMATASAEATRALFDKYRAGLFGIDAGDSDVIAAMAQDAMTWDSLIHTIYFDQTEVADMIGEYIADHVAA